MIHYYLIMDIYLYECEFCGKKFKNKGGYAAHIPYCHKNPNRTKRIISINAHKHKGSFTCNKGKIIVNKNEIKKFIYKDELQNYLNNGWNVGFGDKFREKMKFINSHKIYPGKAGSPEAEQERRRKISETMKKNPLAGGLREGSGRGKKGWYKGIFCDSSWELAFVIYHIDHNIPIKRCEEKRPYEYKGRIHYYIPDFIVNDKIIEIKGFNTEQWQVKMLNNKDVTVLYEEDMKPYFEYVESKYGKNYIEMYDRTK